MAASRTYTITFDEPALMGIFKPPGNVYLENARTGRAVATLYGVTSVEAVTTPLPTTPGSVISHGGQMWFLKHTSHGSPIWVNSNPGTLDDALVPAESGPTHFGDDWNLLYSPTEA